MEQLDQVYPFNINNGVLTVNSKTGLAGVLEFQVVKGLAYLIRGAVNKEGGEAAVNSIPVPGWDLANNLTSAISTMLWDGNESSFTVYSPEAAAGYVRVVICQ